MATRPHLSLLHSGLPRHSSGVRYGFALGCDARGRFSAASTRNARFGGCLCLGGQRGLGAAERRRSSSFSCP